MKPNCIFTQLRIIAVLIALSATFCAGAKKQADEDSVRILFIGNSFTYHNNMPDMVRDIATTQKLKYSCSRIVKGGQRLSGHLKDPVLTETLAKGGWDYVIIQEQSSDPAGPTSLVREKVYPAAHTLDSLVHAGSPDAKVIFFMTWGHKYGSIFNVRNNDHSYPLSDSYEGMQERLKTSYLEMAYDNNAWCAPVGMAWKVAKEQMPNLWLYNQDSYHPSKAGSYLAANVIFTTILQRHYQTKYDAGLSPETAEALQRIAQDTVLDNLTLLNIAR